MLTAKYFQQEAAKLAVQELDKQDRASVVMCCGSGKTFTGILISEYLKAKIVCVVAPTILLVKQIADEYRVNSQRKVLEYHSEIHQDELDILASGDSAVITTYNSAPELFALIGEKGFTVNLVIYDEAHRTAGKYSSLFNETLQGYPHVQKRLGMTATPRHAAIDEKNDDTEFFSMDNPSVYGKIVYTYQIRKAIEDGVITDYKLLVACVSDADVRQYLKGKTVSSSSHKTYALGLTLRRAIEQYGLKKIITYHATIDEANKAARIFAEVLDIPVTHISSRQGPYTRDANFSLYRDSEACVITNARSLNEGMNVPNTDAVMFCSTKSSEIDIIQCAGRAMRTYTGKKDGYIILPVLSGENSVEFSDFSDILNVLNALSENDELIHQAIKLNTPVSDSKGRMLLHSFFRFTDDVSFNIDTLAEKIYLKVYDTFNRNFFSRVEQLKDFIREHGHARVRVGTSGPFGIWVRFMRKLRSEGRLAPEKERILDELGFIWDVNEALFIDNIEGLKEFLASGGTVEQASVGPYREFLKSRRAAYRKGILPDNQYRELTALGVYFDTQQHIFETNFQKLKEVITDNGLVPKSSGLTHWVKYLRVKYKNNELSQKEIADLKNVGLVLSVSEMHDDIFNRKLGAASALMAECKPLTHELQVFLKNQRSRYKANKLEQHRIDKIREYEMKFHITILK